MKTHTPHTLFWSTYAKEGILFEYQKDLFYVGIHPTFHQTAPENILSFYLNDFFLQQNNPWITFQEGYFLSKEALLFQLNKELDPRLTLPFKEKKGVFENTFLHIQKAISNTTLKKGVAYTSFSAEGSFSPLSLLKQTLIDPKKGNIIGFWSLEKGFIGKTPEMLFSLKENLLSTEALAGTYIEGKKPSQEEHFFVQEELETLLRPLGTLTKQEGEKHYGSLIHLCTQFQVLLTERLSFEKALSLFHPTSALGTFPKNPLFLKELEKIEKREYLGAPIGILFPEKKEMKTFVMIRTLFFEGKKLFLKAGCGIVEKSLLSNEKKEVQAKKEATAGTFFKE